MALLVAFVSEFFLIVLFEGGGGMFFVSLVERDDGSDGSLVSSRRLVAFAACSCFGSVAVVPA